MFLYYRQPSGSFEWEKRSAQACDNDRRTSGSGKSTVGIVANKMGLPYLDTGAIYRAVTLKLIEDGITPDETEE